MNPAAISLEPRIAFLLNGVEVFQPVVRNRRGKPLIVHKMRWLILLSARWTRNFRTNSYDGLDYRGDEPLIALDIQTLVEQHSATMSRPSLGLHTEAVARAALKRRPEPYSGRHPTCGWQLRARRG